jgi:transposase
MNQQDKRTQRDYTLAFKLAVVDQVERGEMTYKKAQERYGIQGRSTVLTWLRKHGRLDWSVAETPRGILGMEERASPPLTPDQRIKELEQQLKEATLKADLLESMLDIIRTEYGVSLPKKPLRSSAKKRSD